MNWKQRFKSAQNRKAFNRDDEETARSWTRGPVGDMLRSRGYKKRHTHGQLAMIIKTHDVGIVEMRRDFIKAIDDSMMSMMSTSKERIKAVNKVKKIYNKIQKTKPSQVLIDELELTVTVTPASA